MSHNLPGQTVTLNRMTLRSCSDLCGSRLKLTDQIEDLFIAT